MVNFKENYHFPRSIIFQGSSSGLTFSRGGGGGGGSCCLFNIETHITYDFPGGGGVCPPSGSAHVNCFFVFLLTCFILLHSSFSLFADNLTQQLGCTLNAILGWDSCGPINNNK